MSRTNDSGPPEGGDKSPAFLLHREGYTIEDYRLIMRIGEGSFGEVWKAERGGLPVALKILKTSMTSDETQRELKSLETLKRLHHKFLLHTQNFWSDGDRLFIEMELAEGGTLKERLKACQATGRAGIPEDELLKYFGEAGKALDYLHGHRPVFLHRDIKPANILLVQGCAKLADFGLLRQVAGDNSSTKTQGGTFPYMAPESIASDVFSVYTDLFSFAVTYAELRQGELPFSGKNQYQICEKILRAAPELTGIFHPDERKVLLKALEKEPRQRFASCGEFVFELNRVVPWIPAVEVIYPAAPPTPERGVSAKGTDHSQPMLTDPGTTRKRPGTTMPDVGLPATPETVSRDDGTVIARPGKPAPEPVSNQPTIAPPSALQKMPPPPRKAPPRSLVAIGLAAVVIAIFTAIWLVVGQGAKSEVRELIAKNKFPEALTAIKDANRLFLPNPGELQKEVETKWWAELPEPGANESPESLKKSLRELEKFKEAFPGHDGAKARQSNISSNLLGLLGADVDRLLAAKNMDAASELLSQYAEVLPDKGKLLQRQIDGKQEVLAVLKRSNDKLKKNDFDGCLDLLKNTQAPFEQEGDISARSKMLESARAGASARDEAHQNLVTSLEAAFKAKKTAQVKAKLDELIKFRAAYAKSDWQPDLSKYQPTLVLNGQFAEAWRPLLADKVSPVECRRALKEVKDQLDTLVLDPTQEKNLLALDTLIKAHESGKGIAELITLLRNDQGTDLARNLWLGLAQLEKSKRLFRFDDLDVLPMPMEEQAKIAGSDLFARTLERLVKKDGYAWFASKAEAAKCAAWCEQRISSPSDTLRAFHAECLLASGADLPKINAITLPVAADWYGSYVRALVMEKNKKPAEAAEVLKTQVKTVNPAERRKSAVAVLRSAAAALPRSGTESKEFANGKDALKAIDWLTPALGFEEPPMLDDLVGLAFAAVKADTKESSKTLGLVEHRADKLPVADRAKAYSWLGKAYGLEMKQANANAANRQFDQAIEKSTAAQQFAQHWKKLDLENAAALNGKAVEIEARAAFDRTANKAEKGEAKYRVFERALQKASDAVIVPVIIAKMEFAWSDDCPAAYLKKTISEGESALKLAAAEEQARPASRDWWATVRCKSMMRLADVSMRSLKERANAKEPFDNLAGELTGIRTLYEDVRKMKKYTERWNGELAFKIGNLDLALGKSDQAVAEFAESLKSLKTIRQPYPAEIRVEIEQARAFLEKALATLKKSSE